MIHGRNIQREAEIWEKLMSTAAIEGGQRAGRAVEQRLPPLQEGGGAGVTLVCPCPFPKVSSKPGHAAWAGDG